MVPRPPPTDDVYFKITGSQILDLRGLLVRIKNKMSKQFTYDVHRTIHFIFYSWSQDRELRRKITYSITKPQRWLNWFLLGRRKEKRIENTSFPLPFLSLNSTLCLSSLMLGSFVFIYWMHPLPLPISLELKQIASAHSMLLSIWFLSYSFKEMVLAHLVCL